jgi:hypothetical protein
MINYSAQAGSLLVKLPLPPGTFPTLWKNDAGGPPVPLGVFSQVAKDMFQSDESRWRTSSIQRARESERERENENENEREIVTVRQSDSQTVRQSDSQS